MKWHLLCSEKPNKINTLSILFIVTTLIHGTENTSKQRYKILPYFDEGGGIYFLVHKKVVHDNVLYTIIKEMEVVSHETIELDVTTFDDKISIFNRLKDKPILYNNTLIQKATVDYPSNGKWQKSLPNLLQEIKKNNDLALISVYKDLHQPIMQYTLLKPDSLIVDETLLNSSVIDISLQNLFNIIAHNDKEKSLIKDYQTNITNKIPLLPFFDDNGLNTYFLVQKIKKDDRIMYKALEAHYTHLIDQDLKIRKNFFANLFDFAIEASDFDYGVLEKNIVLQQMIYHHEDTWKYGNYAFLSTILTKILRLNYPLALISVHKQKNGGDKFYYSCLQLTGDNVIDDIVIDPSVIDATLLDQFSIIAKNILSKDLIKTTTLCHIFPYCTVEFESFFIFNMCYGKAKDKIQYNVSSRNIALETLQNNTEIRRTFLHDMYMLQERVEKERSKPILFKDETEAILFINVNLQKNKQLGKPFLFHKGKIAIKLSNDDDSKSIFLTCQQVLRGVTEHNDTSLQEVTFDNGDASLLSSKILEEGLMSATKIHYNLRLLFHNLKKNISLYIESCKDPSLKTILNTFLPNDSTSGTSHTERNNKYLKELVQSHKILPETDLTTRQSDLSLQSGKKVNNTAVKNATSIKNGNQGLLSRLKNFTKALFNPIKKFFYWVSSFLR